MTATSGFGADLICDLDRLRLGHNTRQKKSPIHKCMTLKNLVLTAAIAAAAAHVAGPVDATSMKRKKVTTSHAPVTTPYARRNNYRVYDLDCTVLGANTDPFICSQIRRDPRPWEGND